MNNSTIAPPTDDNIIPTSIRWVFIILLVVYAWQALWMLYGLTTIWRKTSYGYLYVAPGYMHPSVYWCFCGTNLSSVATILLVHFNLGIFALASTVVAMVFVYISLFMSLRRVYIRAPVLIRELRKSGSLVGKTLCTKWLGFLRHMAHLCRVVPHGLCTDRSI